MILFMISLLIASKLRAQRRNWRSAILLLLLVNSLLSPSLNCYAGDRNQSKAIKLTLRDKVEIDSNVVVVADLVDIQGPTEVIESWGEFALGPGPRHSMTQSWVRDDIGSLLELQGISSDQFQWFGATNCNVSRVANPSSVDLVQERRIQTTAADLVDDHQTPTTPSDREFAPAQVNSQTKLTAQRNVATIVATHLKQQSDESLTYIVEPAIPDEHARLLMRRQSIVGILGGEEPWTGDQNFMLRVLSSAKETVEIPIRCDVQLPPSVWAAKGPLPRGRILSSSDLKTVPLVPGNRVELADCYERVEDLVGLELRRAISTGQMIQRVDAGPARVISASESIEIAVVAGAMIAQTSGKAMQSGGINEIIQVEIVGSHKRLAARIVGPGQVEALAGGTSR